MAHQSNVVQVMKDSDSNTPLEMVKDPVCGMEFPKKEAKSVLFRQDDIIYFCSKDCQTQFLNPKKPQTGTKAA